MGDPQGNKRKIIIQFVKLFSALMVIMACQFIFGFGCQKFQAVDLQKLTEQSSRDITPGLGAPQIDGQQVYNSNCLGCHGNIRATTIDDPSAESINNALNEIAVMRGLKSSLNQAQIKAVSQYLTSGNALAQCEVAKDPGFVSIHRLNNIEYDNTMADLLGIKVRLSEEMDFAPDSQSGGFLNNAESINTTGVQAQKFFEAAEEAINRVFANATLKNRLMNCNPEQNSCVQKTLSSFLYSAFRRPATAQELARYSNYVDDAKANGDEPELGIKAAMIAALTSPHFLFRVPDHSAPNNATKVESLNAYDLASRLSYFLWSSMPDAELMKAASSGDILTDNGLETQVRRMLQSPKAKSLINNFVYQWMGLDKMSRVKPDEQLYSSFSDALRKDMETETKLFFQDLLERDGSFYELLSGKHTFLNSRLASHYGISGVSGTDFRRVEIPNNLPRQGVLTHASLLSIASDPQHGSIVKRGNFVLANILCSPPPPPPPDTGELSFDDIKATTRRAALEQHRSDPNCFSCHAQIDPLGFGYENFDAIGQYFSQDEQGRPVDATGEMPDGTTFEGPIELASIISQDDRFQTCVAEKLFTYGLGRNVQSYDRCTINRIGLNMVDSSKSVSDVIIEIVKSDPFRKQRGAGGQ